MTLNRPFLMDENSEMCKVATKIYRKKKEKKGGSFM